MSEYLQEDQPNVLLEEYPGNSLEFALSLSLYRRLFKYNFGYKQEGLVGFHKGLWFGYYRWWFYFGYKKGFSLVTNKAVWFGFIRGFGLV